ncbi:MAG TPA: SIR2 family protein [Bacteriovoracaceae bacterium]|nr:SIR2 family protein [Bacteriovoracaceae bacterium]
MTIDVAIFLGAGASKAEGAPLQGELFYDYFSSNEFQKNSNEMDRELATFFNSMFNIEIDKKENLKNIIFPTFEEVLGMIDLGLLRKESFKDFDLENRASNSGRLRTIAQHLVFLVAKTLDQKLKTSTTIHKQLVGQLLNANLLKKTAFISTNYDILIDNALTDKFHSVDLNYGVDFRNFNWPDDWKRPKLSKNVYLLKLHGSLNWLFCPTCNELEITPKEKGVVTKLITNFEDAACKECDGIYSPIIIPPSFHKDMNNVFLGEIWNKADNILRKVKHIIFCGYSFPDADIHIKYLLKRAQVNRRSQLHFTVINHYKDKKPSICADEKYRYERFLGASSINYTNKSFEDFAKNPFEIISSLL